VVPRRKPSLPARGQPADMAVANRRVRPADAHQDGDRRSRVVRRVVTITVVPLREGHRSTPLPSIAPTRCRRWCRSRCAEGETDAVVAGGRGDGACGGGRTGRWVASKPARRRQRARWSPSESRIAVWTESTRVEWRRSSTPRMGEGAKPARLGTAGNRNGIDVRQCLGGSHEGPPIPLRQRRDCTPR
jgi:hypothetical protein